MARLSAIDLPVLHHVALIVADLEKAAHLYGEVLGLEPDYRPDLKFEGLFYKLGHGQQLHLMKLDNPDAQSVRPKHGGRYRHMALSVADLSQITRQLDILDIDYTRSLSGREAVFLYDADGNSLELIVLPKVTSENANI
ncbi:MAG: VOC family protein [Mariprofundaceae bacterium]|nr:VOC family protein [Mariprofundaceae bacterium]